MRIVERYESRQPTDDPPAEGELAASSPTYTTIRVDGVSLRFYLAVREGDDSFDFMPDGLRAQVVGEVDGGLEIHSCWDTLSQGREFFSRQLASNVQRAVEGSDERGDFVREESRLTGFRLGGRADEFDQHRFDEIPPATAFVTRVYGGHETEPERVAAYEAVLAASGLTDHLGGPLSLHMATVFDDSWQAIDVWTSADIARSYYEARLQSAVLETYTEIVPPRIELKEFTARVCMVSTATLAAHAFRHEGHR